MSNQAGTDPQSNEDVGAMKEIASKLSLTNRKKHLDRGPGLYKRNMAEVEAIEKQLREAEMLRKRQEWDAARAAGSAKPASMAHDPTYKASWETMPSQETPALARGGHLAIKAPSPVAATAAAAAADGITASPTPVVPHPLAYDMSINSDCACPNPAGGEVDDIEMTDLDDGISGPKTSSVHESPTTSATSPSDSSHTSIPPLYTEYLSLQPNDEAYASLQVIRSYPLLRDPQAWMTFERDHGVLLGDFRKLPRCRWPDVMAAAGYRLGSVFDHALVAGFWTIATSGGRMRPAPLTVWWHPAIECTRPRYHVHTLLWNFTLGDEWALRACQACLNKSQQRDCSLRGLVPASVDREKKGVFGAGSKRLAEDESGMDGGSNGKLAEPNPTAAKPVNTSADHAATDESAIGSTCGAVFTGDGRVADGSDAHACRKRMRLR